MAQGIQYGNYYLLGRLSEGGMAEIFLGKPLDAPDPKRLIAVKRIIKQHQSNPAFVAMLKDEARIAIGLDHPNICNVIELGEFNRQLFLVMEFIHGKELGSVQYQAQENQQALPLEYSILVVAQIASALGYAHRKTDDTGKNEEIVHRDVNPQNIFVGFDGCAKLIDFGIAKAKDRITRTKLGMVKGKCGYMSPEQVSGEHLDGRSDIFALGVVLYELVTGKQAFTGASEFEIFQSIAQTRYTPPQKANAHIPEHLSTVIDKSLAQDPNERYQDGQEFADDLLALLRTQALSVEEVQTNLSNYLKTLYAESYEKEINQIGIYESVTPPGQTKSDSDAPPVELTASQEPPEDERPTGATVPELLAYNPENEEAKEDEALGGSTLVDMPVYEPEAPISEETSANDFEDEPTVQLDSSAHLSPFQNNDPAPQEEIFEDERTRQLDDAEIEAIKGFANNVAQNPTKEHKSADVSDSAIPTGVIQTSGVDDVAIGVREAPVLTDSATDMGLNDATKDVSAQDEDPFVIPKQPIQTMQLKPPTQELDAAAVPSAPDENGDMRASGDSFAIPKTPIQTMKIKLPTEEEAMEAIRQQEKYNEPESTEEIAFSSQDISFMPPDDIQTNSAKEQAPQKIDKSQAIALGVAIALGLVVVAGVYFWTSLN